MPFNLLFTPRFDNTRTRGRRGPTHLQPKDSFLDCATAAGSETAKTVRLPQKSWLPLAALVILGLPASPAIALFQDRFQPYASIQGFYDDNLFRLPDNGFAQTAGGGRIRGVGGVTFTGGALLRKPFRLQQFYFDAAYHYRLFDGLSELNFGGVDLDTHWDWVLGKRLSGALGFFRKVDLADYAFYQTTEKNVITEDRFFFRPSYEITPSWRLNGAFERADRTISAAPINSRDDNIFEIGLDRISPKGSKIGPLLRFTDGRFPGRKGNLSGQPDRFQQWDADLRINWEISIKARLNANVGWTHRHLTGQNFSGVTGQLAYTHAITEFTGVAVTAQRQLQFPLDSQGDSALVYGITVQPRWSPREGLNLTGLVEWSRYNYSVSHTRENYFSLGLQIAYKPMRHVEFLIGAKHESRTSSVPGEDYEDNAMNAAVQLSF